MEGKGQEEEKMSRADGKIEGVKYFVETWGKGVGVGGWLKAQISFLNLGSVQESCTHRHTHSAKAVTATLTRATALIYGLFDLHDNPSAPIHSLAGPAIAAINTGWT